MSFSKTTEQIRQQMKWVTRRWGWWNIKVGERVCAIAKGMGLKKGEKVERLRTIECVSARPDPLCNIDKWECELEGFPNMEPEELVALILSMRPRHEYRIDPNRIAFKYVED